jgi:osmoprotectant transport system ATP-binding protein
MGYVIQNAGLFPHRTIAANIATVPRLLGWGRAKARTRALELMELVGLDPALAARYPYQLSGGQQQRVGVARALAADPPVLLMDEPFSAVDPVVRKGLQAELLRLQAELAKTIVFVTHDIDEAVRIGDRIAVLRTGGHLAQFATPDELLSAPADAFVEDFLGTGRGLRRLSFFPSDTLPLLAPDAAEVPYALVCDEAGRPRGWRPREATQDAGARDLIPCGRPFVPGREPLREALDCAVLSPTGWAVAVDDEGRAVGVVSQEGIAEAIRSAHAVSGVPAGGGVAEAAPAPLDAGAGPADADAVDDADAGPADRADADAVRDTDAGPADADPAADADPGPVHDPDPNPVHDPGAPREATR